MKNYEKNDLHLFSPSVSPNAYVNIHMVQSTLDLLANRTNDSTDIYLSFALGDTA